MGKKIIVTCEQENILVKHFINEETVYLGDKEEVVKKWLSQHFKPIDVQDADELSLPKITRAFAVLDAYGNVSNNVKSAEDVFYILQAKFKKILNDKKDRDNFLKDVLNKFNK